MCHTTKVDRVADIPVGLIPQEQSVVCQRDVLFLPGYFFGDDSLLHHALFANTFGVWLSFYEFFCRLDVRSVMHSDHSAKHGVSIRDKAH